jgi:hypothetical protein
VAVSHQHLRSWHCIDYQAEKIFHIKETCVVHPCARPRGDGLPLTATSARKCSEQRRHHAGRICKLQKRLLNGRFYGAQILMCRGGRRLLKACWPGAPRANAASGTLDSPLKKKLSESRRKA